MSKWRRLLLLSDKNQTFAVEQVAMLIEAEGDVAKIGLIEPHQTHRLRERLIVSYELYGA